MTTTLATDSREPTPAPRLHGLDALRGGALLLGIVLHSLMPFVPGLPWLVVDQTPRTYTGAVSTTIHLFRMPLFMLLAGYFARVVVHRRGMRRYLRERALRIALPVFAFWPIAVLPLGLIAGAWADAHGIPIGRPPSGANPLATFPTAHLWFLWTLFQICLLVAAVRFVALRVAPTLTDRAASAAARAAATPWSWLGLAVPFLMVRWWQARQGVRRGLDNHTLLVHYAGVQPPDGLLPVPVALLAYGTAFGCGWLLARRPGSLEAIGRRWPVNLTAAAVLSTGLLWRSGMLGLPEPTASPVVAVLSSLAAWAWVHGLVGMCVATLRTERFWVRYLADASYWMYLVHLPLLVGIGALLTHLGWPPELKIALTLGTTTALLLLSYDGFVRSTWLGRWLNGHRWERAILTRRSPR